MPTYAGDRAQRPLPRFRRSDGIPGVDPHYPPFLERSAVDLQYPPSIGSSITSSSGGSYEENFPHTPIRPIRSPGYAALHDSRLRQRWEVWEAIRDFDHFNDRYPAEAIPSSRHVPSQRIKDPDIWGIYPSDDEYPGETESDFGDLYSVGSDQFLIDPNLIPPSPPRSFIAQGFDRFRDLFVRSPSPADSLPKPYARCIESSNSSDIIYEWPSTTRGSSTLPTFSRHNVGRLAARQPEEPKKPSLLSSLGKFCCKLWSRKKVRPAEVSPCPSVGSPVLWNSDTSPVPRFSDEVNIPLEPIAARPGVSDASLSSSQ